MPSVSSNNKRIARNTLFMYARMLLVMCVSLYTVRVVLKALGSEDYGINNVVGGIVTMLGFLSSTMSGASMRFFSYELGRKDYKKLSDFFSITFWFYVILVIGVVILAETIGLWFVYNKLVIPDNRINAALWVYQCSIIGFAFQMLAIPYNSLILARERMDIYAYVGIAEVLLKLLVAYLIKASPFDKLFSYAVLLMLATSFVSAFYIIYDVIKFPESRVRRYWDKQAFREIFSYSSWNLFSSVALVARSQGINILINIFFGPIVNTARAIAYQVNNAVNTFVTGFTQAVRPQITKYYAANEMNQMLALTYRTTRLCFFLIFLLSTPLILETRFVLVLWLGEVSDMTILFTRLVLLTSIIDATSIPLTAVISSTGKIKYTQLTNGLILIAILPLSYVFYKFGFPPQTTMIIAFIASLLCHINRIYFSCKLTTMTFSDYFNETIIPIVIILLLGGGLSIALQIVIKGAPIAHFLGIVVSSTLVNSLIVYLFGLKKAEKVLLSKFIQDKVLHRTVN